MAKKIIMKTYVVDLLELQIVHVQATSKTDACKRVNAGEGDLVQSAVDQWAAGSRYCRVAEED